MSHKRLDGTHKIGALALGVAECLYAWRVGNMHLYSHMPALRMEFQMYTFLSIWKPKHKIGKYAKLAL